MNPQGLTKTTADESVATFLTTDTSAVGGSTLL